MLRSAKSIVGFQLECLDGTLGAVKDLYFHDDVWAIRYVVVDPQPLLPGRKVLIPPAELQKPEWSGSSLPVNLTREQVETSPPIEAHRPVSRQEEAELHRFFQWIPYWGPAGTASQPLAVPLEEKEEENPAEATREGDARLRSFDEVSSYGVSALDGEVGHIEDMILDDDAWLFQMFVVDTRNWLPGKHVVLDTEWIGRIDHTEKMVVVDLKRDVIKDAPEYDPADPINEEYERRLYDYYGRPKNRANR
ncbi:MAG: PRC-barrel domain-containing protein [Candidatus Hydrogenedentota bacterium]